MARTRLPSLRVRERLAVKNFCKWLENEGMISALRMKFESGALLFSIGPKYTVGRLDVRSTRRISSKWRKPRACPIQSG
jgi:hypothetical protein